VRGSGRGGSVRAQSAKRASRAGLRVAGRCGRGGWRTRRRVDAHAVQQRAGDRFLASQDGADRRAADQVGQAADHAAGALLQVPGLGGPRRPPAARRSRSGPGAAAPSGSAAAHRSSPAASARESAPGPAAAPHPRPWWSAAAPPRRWCGWPGRPGRSARPGPPSRRRGPPARPAGWNRSGSTHLAGPRSPRRTARRADWPASGGCGPSRKCAGPRPGVPPAGKGPLGRHHRPRAGLGGLGQDLLDRRRSRPTVPVDRSVSCSMACRVAATTRGST